MSGRVLGADLGSVARWADDVLIGEARFQAQERGFEVLKAHGGEQDGADERKQRQTEDAAPLNVIAEEMLHDPVVQAVEHVVKDVDAVADFTETAEGRKVQDSGEGMIEGEEIEDQCGGEKINEGVADGGHDGITGVGMVEEVGRPELAIGKFPGSEAGEKGEHHPTSKAKGLRGLWSADGEGGEATDQQGVGAKWRDSVEELGVEVILRDQIKAGDTGGEQNRDAGEAEVAQGLPPAKGEDDQGPDEIELLFDTQRPEVSQIKREGSWGYGLSA